MNILHGVPKWLPGFRIFPQLVDKKDFLQHGFMYHSVLVITPWISACDLEVEN
jgi:hypothetical protein